MADSATPGAQASEPLTKSPIGQLLQSLGLTREDLTRHSAQMREFLTTENATSLRALSQENKLARPQSNRSESSLSRTPSVTRDLSRTNSLDTLGRHATPPPATSSLPQHSSNLTFVHNSQQSSGHRRGMIRAESSKRQEKTRHKRTTSFASPTRPKPNLDMIMQMRSRDSRRVQESDDSESSDESPIASSFPATKPSSKSTHQTQHSSSSQTTSSTGQSIYYRQESPVATFNGNYYRTREIQEKAMLTPQNYETLYQQRKDTNFQHQMVTPTKSKTRYLTRDNSGSSAQLLPASSPMSSSPIPSSPCFPVNIVSSPGPMDSDPPDQSDPDLPFTLPPGPYSGMRPDLSYAALIGRAILASPDHRLRLKDIYDYVSIVYPYFKRDGHSHSQKWMNAIRQNLTNTPHFHKVEQPNSSVKGSLWCIFDEDLPCFAYGHYDKHAKSPKSGSSMLSKRTERRKRKKEEEMRQDPSKRMKLLPLMGPQTNAHLVNPYQFPYGHPQMVYQYPMFGRPFAPDSHAPSSHNSDIIFPPLPISHPNAHLTRPKAEEIAKEVSDMLFPPLPPYSQTRYAKEIQQASSSRSQSVSNEDIPSPDSASCPPLSSASSTTSIPVLTPNNSSSPPEPDIVLQAEEVDLEIRIESREGSEQSIEQLTPEATKVDKGKGKAIESIDMTYYQSLPRLPPMPSSPTRSRLRTVTQRPASQDVSDVGNEAVEEIRPTTPSTPPPTHLSVSHNISLMRTPVRGKKVEPETTPTQHTVRFAVESVDPGDDKNEGSSKQPVELPRTPSRKNLASSSTPRRAMASPFYTLSPFRTPGRRPILDPSDPSALLEEELIYLGRGRLQDSPAGFFPRTKGLTYESPGQPDSPSSWRPW